MQILPFLLAAAAALAAAWKLTLGGRIIARGDLLLYFYPLRDYASAAAREGRLPLWNPFTFMGAPFLANSQAGFYYPFNLALAWLPVETAVSWSIALHLALAAAGMVALARAGLRVGRLAALAGGLAFALGGYLGAQVEHLNQMQALAWLPWQALCVLLLGRPGAPGQRRRLAAMLALLTALQALAGHTQSLYIALAGLGLMAASQAALELFASFRRAPADPAAVHGGRLRAVAGAFGPLAGVILAALLAALMAAAQLVPTAELAAQSARAGGLPYNEVGSFSWRPWVAARALLPAYGDPLFPEYVAYLGAAGLALALAGAVGRVDSRQSTVESPGLSTVDCRLPTLIALVLTVSGLLLALGIATPLFGVLYRLAPGFNLFRAQARWLILFALGSAMLVALGVEALARGLPPRRRAIWLAGWLGLVALLAAGAWAGARFSPEPEYRALPAAPVLAGWLIAAAAVTAGVALAALGRLPPGLAAAGFTALLAAELGLASQFQPYARAADRQALTELRPATAYLLANRGNGGRVLALSGLFFDPGDLPEQRLIYQGQLSADELYDRVIASKHKEILSPNLSLYYRLPSVDGYDGGLLPLRRYADFVAQFAPRGESAQAATSDGRLREFLSAPPDDRWLDQMAVRYLIADKTQDAFYGGVYYDLFFQQPLTGPLSLPLEPFESTALGLVLSAPGAHAGQALAEAVVTFDDGAARAFDLRATDAVTQPRFELRLRWDERRTPTAVALTPTAAGVIVLGLTSIDEPAGAFQSQLARAGHAMRLAHTGDVKIYENQRAAPRAALETVGSRQSKVESPVLSTVDCRLSTPDSRLSTVDCRLIEDLPEELAFEVDAAGPARLVVRDACYPGWVARVDGREAPINCVNVLFRAVDVPAGRHRVTFRYEPASVPLGLALSAAGWLACLLLAVNRRRT